MKQKQTMLELKRILIIEDDEDHAFLEKDILEESLNVEVDLITSGLDLDRVHIPLYQIILLDFNLPDTTGTEVLEKIRHESDIPVVLVTGRDDLSIAVETLKKGANDFLIKTPETIKMLPTFCQKVFSEYITKKMLESKQKESEIMRIRIETLSQTLTTLSHYINNSTKPYQAMRNYASKIPKKLNAQKNLLISALRKQKR